MADDDLPMTLDPEEMMWAACSYLFWPVFWLAVLASAHREAPFVRYHMVQALVLGISSLLGFGVGTGSLLGVYRFFSPEAMVLNVVMVGLFCAWIGALMLTLLVFLYLAYRAGQGSCPQVPIASSIARQLLP
jgi:uncharacterized membrane protein